MTWQLTPVTGPPSGALLQVYHRSIQSLSQMTESALMTTIKVSSQHDTCCLSKWHPLPLHQTLPIAVLNVGAMGTPHTQQRS